MISSVLKEHALEVTSNAACFERQALDVDMKGGELVLCRVIYRSVMSVLPTTWLSSEFLFADSHASISYTLPHPYHTRN